MDWIFSTEQRYMMILHMAVEKIIIQRSISFRTKCNIDDTPGPGCYFLTTTVYRFINFCNSNLKISAKKSKNLQHAKLQTQTYTKT